MKSYAWKRPALPEANKGVGLPAGSAVMLCGSLAGMAGLSAIGDPRAGFDGVIVAALGFSAASLGLIMVPACMILREIRQNSFEAALRAGEVTVTEIQASDAYEQFMARERAAAEQD